MSDKSGAALPEFAIAVVPLTWLFFIIAEVATMFIAHLVLHHCAWEAARCGIVQKGGYLPGKFVNNDDGKKGTDNGQAETVCQKAAIDAAGEGFWHRTLFNITVSYELKGAPSGGNNKHNEGYADLVTTTKADFKCGGPVLARVPICGSNNGTKPLQVVITLPHEGAQYTIDDNKDGS